MKTKTGIIYTTSVVRGKERLDIHIRLDDECGNKHCDFAIGGELYVKAKNGQWVLDSWGCLHDEILRHYPQYEDFVRLHNCDCHGAPMYAVENGLFLLNDKGVDECARYLRMTPGEVEMLKDVDKEYAAYLLKEKGIVDRWQKEADEAIRHLEALTGDKFVNPYGPDEERPNYIGNTSEEVVMIEERIASGYYTSDAIEKRAKEAENAAREAERDRIQERYDKTIREAEEEKEIMLTVFDALGSEDNVIYYNHRKAVVFNWKEPQFAMCCKHWTKAEFENFVNEHSDELPDDVKVEIKYEY